MTVEMFVAITGFAAFILGALQWWFSHKAASRQRDAEMTLWASDVIDLMAHLETVCFPISGTKPFDATTAEELSYQASALVDKGRLFFPNVKVGKGSADEGTRVKILDEVLRACYVARHLAGGLPGDRRALREHVWAARRRFVTLLQGEMGKSLRRVVKESEGAHIPANPISWQPSTRPLNLPSQPV